MWIKFTADYLAGMTTGAGAALSFAGLGIASDMVSPGAWGNASLVLGAVLLVLGGVWKVRMQQKPR